MSRRSALPCRRGHWAMTVSRVWSEGGGKRGRMFIYFVGLILASYVRSGWSGNNFLRKKYDSTEAVLAEMCTIRCYRTEGPDEVHHAVRRQPGGNLQDLRLRKPERMLPAICLEREADGDQTRTSEGGESGKPGIIGT